MTRSGYSEDCDNGWGLICWRGAVASGIRGKRGQAFLKSLAQALDAMPEKKLVADTLKDEEGNFCTLGQFANHNQIPISELMEDQYDFDYDKVATRLNISPAMVREIVFENDESQYYAVSPEKRWIHMREWVRRNTLSEKKSS